MPYQPKKPCNQNGCPVIIDHGYAYCKDHTPPAPKRAGANERGYTYRWQKLRKMVLVRQPICGHCVEPSIDVHHIIPKSEGGPDTMENLQGLCKSCHAKETNREMGSKPQATLVVDLDNNSGKIIKG